MKDILFRSDNHVFSYRVGGVLIRNDMLLLQKVPGDDGFALPGGHVSFGECSADALIREFREEFHADIQVERLLMVGENFCQWGNLPCQQINLFYLISLLDVSQMPLDGIFCGFDESGNIRTEVEFCWIPLSQLPELKIYPSEAKQHLMSIPRNIVYFLHHP